MSSLSSVVPSELRAWCSSPRPADSAWAAAGVSAVRRASSPLEVWVRWMRISPNSAGSSEIRAWLSPWRTASSIPRMDRFDHRVHVHAGRARRTCCGGGGRGLRRCCREGPGCRVGRCLHVERAGGPVGAEAGARGSAWRASGALRLGRARCGGCRCQVRESPPQSRALVPRRSGPRRLGAGRPGAHAGGPPLYGGGPGGRGRLGLGSLGGRCGGRGIRAERRCVSGLGIGGLRGGGRALSGRGGERILRGARDGPLLGGGRGGGRGAFARAIPTGNRVIGGGRGRRAASRRDGGRSRLRPVRPPEHRLPGRRSRSGPSCGRGLGGSFGVAFAAPVLLAFRRCGPGPFFCERILEWMRRRRRPGWGA